MDDHNIAAAYAQVREVCEELRLEFDHMEVDKTDRTVYSRHSKDERTGDHWSIFVRFRVAGEWKTIRETAAKLHQAQGRVIAGIRTLEMQASQRGKR